MQVILVHEFLTSPEFDSDRDFDLALCFRPGQDCNFEVAIGRVLQLQLRATVGCLLTLVSGLARDLVRD